MLLVISLDNRSFDMIQEWLVVVNELNDSYTKIHLSENESVFITSSGNKYTLKREGDTLTLTFDGSRTSLQAGCLAYSIGPVDRHLPNVSLRVGDDVLIETDFFRDRGQIIELSSSLPKECPYHDDAWADDTSIHEWLEKQAKDTKRDTILDNVEDFVSKNKALNNLSL